MGSVGEWYIAVEGNYIASLPESKRWAKIITPAPSYKIDDYVANPEANNRPKLIMHVELADGRKAQYYPNRVSARKIAMLMGTEISEKDMKKWVGQKIIWGHIFEMKPNGIPTKVLRVTEITPGPGKKK